MKRAAEIVVIAAAPSALAAWALAKSSVTPIWTIPAVAIAVATGLAFDGARRRRLQTVTSVLAAFREGDYGIRAKASDDSALVDVLAELNQLGDVLRGQRFGEMEAWALLRKVMAEVDVVVLAVDEAGRVRLANDAASRLLGRPSRELVNGSIASLGLAELLEGEVPRVVKLSGSNGPWEVRRGAFRLEGVQQTLVVLSDVSRALRDNERDAWRRLIRVMGHEINNSLSPIKSISESLLSLVDPTKRDADWEADLREGLGVIARRAEALGRFMTSYASLARLPPPRPAPVDVRALAKKAAALETRVVVEVEDGPDVTIQADADQLEQVLINLVKNAAEATNKGVRVRWSVEGSVVTIAIEDDGPGVGETANLFVPFFTTKPNGSGIGLALSRQIVEAHDGQLSLTSREDAPGAIACLRLPRVQRASSRNLAAAI